MGKLVTILFILFLASCQAGSPIKDYERRNKPLTFQVSEVETGYARNALYLVKNGKKNPTVILMHACAGVTSKSVGDLKTWKTYLMKNGFNVLAMDHLSSRGETGNNCIGRGRPVSIARLVADVYDATAFLHGQHSVDTSKIFTLGFSMGAMTSGAAASASMYRYYGDKKPRPRAFAGLYGGCRYGGTSYLDYDVNLPVLWLMGGKDGEAPVKSCHSVAKKLTEKGLLTYHEYPDATHCWDCFDLNGFSKTAANGVAVTYHYDHALARDSERRVLEFFSSFK